LWTTPFTVFPILEVWGRYIPEGYLTTCSFDYLTNDKDTKIFVGTIFIWAYAFPMALIVVNYARLFKHVSYK
jgi:r-opsin